MKVINFNRPQSDLQAFAVSIENCFTENPPKSIGEAAAKIKELTGIERKETQVRKFLKGTGFKHLKAGEVPAKALPEEKNEQRRYLGEKLAPPAWKRRKPENGLCFFQTRHTLFGGRLSDVYGVWREYLCRRRPVEAGTMSRVQLTPSTTN